MTLPDRNREPTDEDRFALYAHAHSDLWWAKTQEWNAANWALLLIAGIVGAARTVIPDSELGLLRTWAFLGLVLVVGLAAGWYLASLHANIVHSRKVYRALEKQTGVGQLRALIPKVAGEETDQERGSGFLYVMCAGIGLAVALGVLLLGASTTLSIIAGSLVGVLDIALVARVAEPANDVASPRRPDPEQ